MRFISVLLFAILTVLSTSAALAQGSVFLEFAPDNSLPLLTSSVGTVAQTFLPQNEFIGGAALWLDNTSVAGSVRLELQTLAGTLVTSKTITVGTTGSVPGGQSFHFDFPGQAAVQSNEKYLLKLVSSLPEMSIYYSSRIAFVGHNAPQISAYTNGVGLVDGEEQDYSFKFALYEETEDAEPVISNVATANLNDTQTRIDFNANEPVDFKINYGIQGFPPDQEVSYTGAYTYCGAGVMSCMATLNVQANQTYEYRLTVKDTWGNEVAYVGTFESSVTSTPTPAPSESTSPTPTPSEPASDTVPPVISNLRLPALGDTWVHFAWTTDEASNTTVVVQLLPNLITEGGNSDATLELEHFIKVEDTLTPDSYYQATVTSIDDSGNSSQSSISFLTLQAAPEPTPDVEPEEMPEPEETPLDEEEVIEVTEDPSDLDSPTVTWVDEDGADSYRVDIFDEYHNLEHSLVVSSTERSIRVPALESGNYRAIVYEEHDGAYQKVAQPESFRIDRRSTFEKFMAGLTSHLWYVIGGLGGLVGLGWWYSKRRKPAVVPVAPPMTGA